METRNREVTITGEFEIHVTVTADGARVPLLRSLCAARGWKFLHILLAQGDTPSQPMVTRRVSGTFGDVLAVANELAEQLAEAGFAPTRVKLEVVPWAAGVPQTDADPHPPGGYFEHHVKLLLDGPPPESLVALAVRHSAHLSRNALKSRPDGRQERFVTLRCFRGGRSAAMGRLDALLAELRAAGHACLSLESEYSLYDSCLALDAGWLREEG